MADVQEAVECIVCNKYVPRSGLAYVSRKGDAHKVCKKCLDKKTKKEVDVVITKIEMKGK